MTKLYKTFFLLKPKPNFLMIHFMNWNEKFICFFVFLFFLFSANEKAIAQSSTGTIAAPTGTAPNENWSVTAIGASNLTASIQASGTLASFNGPAWGHTGGATYNITSATAYNDAGFNCIYYGIRLPGNGGDNTMGILTQCSSVPATFTQTWSASVSSNVVTFTGPTQALVVGGNVTPKIIVTFQTSGGAAINVISSNGYYYVPFNQALKVNVLVTGNYTGLGPGGTGTTGSDQPIFDQFNQGHYNNTGGAGICTSKKFGFITNAPTNTVTPTTPVCSGVSNAESFTLSSSPAISGATYTWTFNGGNNGNVTGITNGDNTTSSPYLKTLTNSQTTAQPEFGDNETA